MSTIPSNISSVEPSRYIVKLKPHIDRDTHLDWLRPRLSSQCKITHSYSIINGFAAQLIDASHAIVSSSNDVEKIEADIELEEDNTVEKDQTPSPWGLNRISQKDKLSALTEYSYNDFKYRYLQAESQLEELARGEARIYILERGVRIDHNEFEGRAEWGYVAQGAKKEDETGHGTAVASVAAGKFCGVHKHGRIIVCKRTGPHGSEAIACLNYVKERWDQFKIPSVVNMSFGYHDPNHESTLLDEATEKIIQAGVHVCVSAGNIDCDASERTPARAKGANCVASSTMADARADDSCWGSTVTLFAPGYKIRVADKRDTISLTTKSGTSFACPTVAGLISYLITLHGNLPPDGMTSYLKATAVADALSDTKGSPNLLANNGF